MSVWRDRQTIRHWREEVRYWFNVTVRSHYERMKTLGAAPAELQEIAWVTYLGNLYDITQKEEV